MFFKKSLALTAGVASLAVIGLSFTELPIIRSLHIPFTSSSQIHPLTGLAGKDGDVVAVKLDDTTYAHPQVGLKEADVVYIEQVEGGLTRLAAIYSSTIPPLVGPVRSARISDIELLAQYGKVGFAYSGAQRLMLPVIADANLFDIGATHYGPKFYYNDPTRIAPYAMMVKLPDLIIESKVRGASLAQSKNVGWNFGKLQREPEGFESVHISWPASSYDVRWSTDEDRWLLTHNGSDDFDSNGYHLGPKNFVIQLVSITDSIYKDKVGGVTPFSATVGEGACYLLRDGGSIPCLWSRINAESGTTFTDINGGELKFAPGQTWFALTSKEPVFKRKNGEGAPAPTNK